jgi:hypothetical protein
VYVVSLRNIKHGTKDDYFHMLLLLHFYTVAAEVPSKCSHIILCRDAIIQNSYGVEKCFELKNLLILLCSHAYWYTKIFTEFVYVLMLDFYTFQKRNGI